jgi:hypothetical protein
MVLEQLQHSDHNIVYIAKTGWLKLFSVMQAARPIYANVRMVLIEFLCTLQAGARIIGAEIKQAIEHRTVVAHIEVAQILSVIWEAKNIIMKTSIERRLFTQTHLEYSVDSLVAKIQCTLPNETGTYHGPTLCTADRFAFSCASHSSSPNDGSH